MHGIYIKMSTLVRMYIVFLLKATIIISGSTFSFKVLCYKLEGRWFDPSWCQWNFLSTKILPMAL